jgi:hypothetical protein
MPQSREPFFLRMAIWLRGLEPWNLVLGGVAVGRGFEPQSNLELSFAEILIKQRMVIPCSSPGILCIHFSCSGPDHESTGKNPFSLQTQIF